MSDAPLIRLYSEGREEYEVLRKLAAIGALPGNVEVAEPSERKDRPSGIEGVVYDLARELALEGTRSIAMLDQDDAGIDGATARFCRRLRAELPGRDVSQTILGDRMASVFVAAGGAATIVGVGLRGDELLERFSIQWYAFDDYLVSRALRGRREDLRRNIAIIRFRLRHGDTQT